MAITISGSGIVEANLADNAVTLAKMASGTDGEILTYDASGNPVAVSVGTDGQVLTSTGAGSPPAFETAGGGGKVLQVVSTTVTGTPNTTNTDTSGLGTDVGLNVTLTAVSSTSRYLIMLDCGLVMGSSGNSLGMILSKGGSKIGNGVDDSSRNGVWVRNVRYIHDGDHGVGMSASYLDTSSTTAGVSVTYKSGLVCGGGTCYINRTNSESDVAAIYGSGTQSTLTVMEIEA